MPRESDGELTIVFGPPAEPSLRQHFDAYQAAAWKGRDDEARRYETLEKELFEEIFQGNGEEDSIFDELLSGALETKVRVRRFDFGQSIMRGLWVPTVVIHARDLEFLPGARVVRFPPEAETRNALVAAVGSALKREWVFSLT